MREEIVELAKKTKEASRFVARLSSGIKEELLLKIADRIDKERGFLQEENRKDVEKAKEAGLPKAMIQRLELTDKVIDSMVKGTREIALQPDPVGEIEGMWKRPSGIVVGRMRIPIGVICMIYESRPNVTLDAAALCIKSGNAVILRGGSEAINSNRAIGKVISETLKEFDLPENVVTVVPITDREAIKVLLELEDYIDLVIPRGGEALIRFVVQNSRIPVLKHYKGVCHIFVDESADQDMALRICVNAKVQKPGVCNAVETILVHEGIAKDFVPKLVAELEKHRVEVRGCEKVRAIAPSVKNATEEDWYAEYLDLIVAMKVVKDIDEAIDHVEKYGSNHTESIITRDYSNAQRFLREVDSSTVMVNASTRFSDGGEFGLGAEIGISTTKLHAYGPMGAKDLTITKFVVFGEGQIRT